MLPIRRVIAAAITALGFFGCAPMTLAATPQDKAMNEPSYSTVVDHLVKASVPIRQLGSEGKVAVTVAAGRVVAMAFTADGPNLLWSNPQLGDTDLVRNHPEKLVGGYGGDRVWFGPELDYHWDGKPNWGTFENYKPPTTTDPGAYEFVKRGANVVSLRAKGELPVHGADRRVGFEVERSIRLVKSPLAATDPLMKGVDYVGIGTSHSLRLAPDTKAGQIDLWHLLQIPTGSVLIVPVKKAAAPDATKPLSYGMPGSWIEKSDHILWRYGGEAKAKLGLPVAALTGRTAVLRKLGDGRWCLLVREFPVDAKAHYADHPYGVPRTDQAFQAWDGYGFGEMEFHSPALDAAKGPRQLEETDRLWAFGGSSQSIAAIARKLLDVDVTDVVFERGTQP